MTPDQVLQIFRAEVKTLIPEIIKEVLWTHPAAAEEHYQLKICEILDSICSFRVDIKAICEWLGIEDSFFIDNKLNSANTYDEFFDGFKKCDGGLVILRQITTILEDLDIELA